MEQNNQKVQSSDIDLGRAAADQAQQQNGQQGAGTRLLSDKSFPSAVDFLVFFGIFLLSQGVGAFIGWILFGWPDVNVMQSVDSPVSTVAQYAAGHFNAVTYFVAMSLTLIGFLYYRHRRCGPKVIARFSLRGFNPALLLWGIVFMFAATVVAEPLLSMLPAVPDAYGRGVWMFLAVVIMAPLFEEFIFRGVLLESSRAKYGVTVAWLLSSLAFGIVHAHPTLMVNAAILGLILGFIYIRSSSIWSAIILHAVNNALAYLLLISGRGNVVLSQIITNRTLYILLYIAASAVLVISGYMVHRTLKHFAVEDKNSEQV